MHREPAAGPAADPLHLRLAERRTLGGVLPEEQVVTPDGRPLRWFGAYRYDAVRSVLTDDRFSAAEYGEHLGLGGRYGPILLEMDGPRHRELRAVMQPPFTRQAVEDRVAGWCSVVDDALERLAPARAADLLTDVCQPFPAAVLARVLDLGDDAVDPLRTQITVHGAADAVAAFGVADALGERLAPVIAERAGGTGDDPISLLSRGGLGSGLLRDATPFGQVRLLAIAGTDTLGRATANLLAALLTHPEQLDAVRSDRSLVAAAVDEAMRWECPAVAVPRVAVEPVVVAGCELPAGAMVRCCLSAANRDPDRWERPDEFDVHRERRQSAAFGLGAHTCLGLHLARAVMAHVLVSVFDHLPGLRLDPASEPPMIVGTDVRSPDHLRIRWD